MPHEVCGWMLVCVCSIFVIEFNWVYVSQQRARKNDDEEEEGGKYLKVHRTLNKWYDFIRNRRKKHRKRNKNTKLIIVNDFWRWFFGVPVQTQTHNYHIIDPLDTIYKLWSYFFRYSFIQKMNSRKYSAVFVVLCSCFLSFPFLFISLFLSSVNVQLAVVVVFRWNIFFSIIISVMYSPRCAQFSDILLATKHTHQKSFTKLDEKSLNELCVWNSWNKNELCSFQSKFISKLCK